MECRRFIVNPDIGDITFSQWCKAKGLTHEDVLYLLCNVKLIDTYGTKM